jgi:TP901 family phage tail tape measure protein
MGFRLANLIVEITADSKPLDKELAQVRSNLAQTLAGMGSLASKAAMGIFGAFSIGFDLLGKAASAVFDTVSSAISAAASAMTGALIGVGVALAAGTAYAVNEAVKLETRMAALAKASDLEGDALADLKSELLKLSTTMAGIRVDDLLDIATAGAKLGIAAKDLPAYAEGVAMVASAMDDIPAGVIADEIGKLNSVFKLGIQGTKQFGSAIDKLADSGVSSAKDILDITQRISGTAVAARITAQESTALAAALLDTGTNAEAGATALQKLIMSLNSPDLKERKNFARLLGMDMKTFAETVDKKPIVAIKKFLTAVKGMNALGQQTAIASIGIDNIHGIGEIQKLAQQVDTLDKYVGLANSEFRTLDQLTKSYNASAQTAGAQLSALWNHVQILADKVGGLLLPALKRLVSESSQAIGGFEGFLKDNEATFAAWGASIEWAIGVGASAWKHWEAALDVVKEFTKEKIQNVKEVFYWLLANIPPVMDRIRDAIVDGFTEAWKQAKAVNIEGMRSLFLDMVRAMIPGAATALKGFQAAFGAAPVKLGPLPKARDFVPLALSSNPALATALSRLRGFHQQDEEMRGAKSIDEIVAEGMKNVGPPPVPTTIAGRRDADAAPKPLDPNRKPGGDFRTFTRHDVEAARAASEQARDARELGSAIDREKQRQRTQDWHLRHPFSRGHAPGEAVAQAMRNPPADMAAAMAAANKKVGVTDADSYHRELTEGGLKSAEKIAESQLKVAESMDAKLATIATNTAGGGKGAAVFS